jgi:hypothetical protein
LQKDDLQENYKLMKLKQLIQRYGIQQFNISDTYLAFRLVRYILNQDDTNSLLDAMECADAYHNYTTMELFIIRSQWLLKTGHLDRFSNLIIKGKENDSIFKEISISTTEKIAILNELENWVHLNLQYFQSIGS